MALSIENRIQKIRMDAEGNMAVTRGDVTIDSSITPQAATADSPEVTNIVGRGEATTGMIQSSDPTPTDVQAFLDNSKA